MVNYHCLTCTRKSNVRAKCRLEAELKAKKAEEDRAKLKREKDKEERVQADELAGVMYEFFTGVYDESTVFNDTSTDHRPSASSIHELPFPSPDSITVTTEFGVIAEPANITTVSAAGPSPYHHAYDQSDDEENNVEMTENLDEEEGIDILQQGMAQMQLPTNTHVHGMSAHILHVPVDVEPEHVQDDSPEDDHVNDTGEEADIDTDGFEVNETDVEADALNDQLVNAAIGTMAPTTTTTAI
jgi:hypothetical protein